MVEIVLIDETPANRAVLAAALRFAGHCVLVADDGDAMLTIAHTPPPDLMIIDVFDGALDGLATVVRLSGLCPHLPLIALSPCRRDLETALDMGASATLTKPSLPTEAIATVNMVLRQVEKRSVCIA